jgi:1,4-alpha-glucan branching enzyme
MHEAEFHNRPFIVIAEDSWRRARITDDGYRSRAVVDSMWDFEFRDTVRQIVSNMLGTKLGETSRSRRVRQALTVNQSEWDLFNDEERGKRFFRDLAGRVTYCTSHDIEGDQEQRLLPYYLYRLAEQGRYSGQESLLAALAAEQVVSTFALTLTAAGIPMFLAGEEFAELHDIDRRNWRHKMSDPIDWFRETLPGHRDVRKRVRELVGLRVSHQALHRNEVEFFGFDSANPGFHPRFDGNDGERLFAYCRTGGQPLGGSDQVVVGANCNDQDYPVIKLMWPWAYRTSLREWGGIGQAVPYIDGTIANISLGSFQVRVFSV